MEITTVLVIEQIVIAALIAIGIAVVYTGLVLGVSACLQENSKNYPEVE